VPQASVIVPARNAAATLPRTLEALADQEFDGAYEVIVVDDGSTDATRHIAASAGGNVRVLAQPASGPAAARNLGVAEARASSLAFCDADVFPTPRWLAAGLRALGGADLVQGHVLPDPSAKLGPFDRTLWITYEVGLYETANLFVSSEMFERTGGFEEWLRPDSGKPLAEDVRFGWKARRLGARTSFSADALAYHAVFARDWRAYVAERRRTRYFAAMAAAMPEMRRGFFYRRLFLTRRSALFDLGLAGTLAAAVLRSPWPLAAAAPYVRLLARSSGRGDRALLARAGVAAADVAADAVTLAWLARGSARYRSPVL
jgi:glycosyltransferase involved in cell wall biosynthesis